MVKRQSKKGNEVTFYLISYDCMPPDSERHLDAVGCFVLPGNNHDVARSPILIPELSNEIRSNTVLGAGTTYLNSESASTSFLTYIQVAIPGGGGQ